MSTTRAGIIRQIARLLIQAQPAWLAGWLAGRASVSSQPSASQQGALRPPTEIVIPKGALTEFTNNQTTQHTARQPLRAACLALAPQKGPKSNTMHALLCSSYADDSWRTFQGVRVPS